MTVLGVSNDPVAKQLAFSNKYQLGFDLLSDPEARIIRAFGVPMTNGRAARETFMFHQGRMIWHDRKVDPMTQARDVFSVIRKVEGGALEGRGEAP